MAGWDGNGAFTRFHDWTDDRDGGIKIQASRFDNENDTFAAGIQACLAKNGENAATANLDLGGFLFTNAGNSTARTDLARVSQVQDGAYISATAGGTADALTVSLSPAITAYTEGVVYVVTPASNNATTTPTVNFNSIAAKTIVKYGSQALVAADIVADEPALLSYNSTDDNMNLINPASAQNFVENAITASSTDTLTNKTIVNGSNTLTFSSAQTFGAKPTVSISGSPGQIDFKRSDEHGAGQQFSRVDHYGRSSTPADVLFAREEYIATVVTAGAEDVYKSYITRRGGAFAERFRVGSGLYHPSATGTDKGDNTINFGAIYDNGVQVTSEGNAKAWVTIDGDATPANSIASFNITSVTDNGTGDYTITIATDFSAATYAFATAHRSATGAVVGEFAKCTAKAVGSIQFECRSTGSGTVFDPEELSVTMWGAQ